MMKPRLIIEKIDFNIEAYRDERGALSLPITELPTIPARLQSVSGSVDVHFKNGVEVSEQQLRVLGQQTEARFLLIKQTTTLDYLPDRMESRSSTLNN
mmetsp:Transcript_10141/g.15339  ORF Transcript_10141/g.15339 Transcript_10141/m.15339 type:complete len:98 (-) Transcript_10141:14-307(-)